MQSGTGCDRWPPEHPRATRVVAFLFGDSIGRGSPRHTIVIPCRYRVAAGLDEPSSMVRQVQSMGEFEARGRIDLTGQVVLIVEEQPIVALNMQIAAEEAGGEAIIARGPNEALAQLHQFMVSAAVIDPRQHALKSELQLRRIRFVFKVGSTGEVVARLAASASKDASTFERCG